MSDGLDLDRLTMAATRSAYPPGHTIHMSLDHADTSQSFSVAECDCGWANRVEWPGQEVEQDFAVETHWRAIGTIVFIALAARDPYRAAKTSPQPSLDELMAAREAGLIEVVGKDSSAILFRMTDAGRAMAAASKSGHSRTSD